MGAREAKGSSRSSTLGGGGVGERPLAFPGGLGQTEVRGGQGAAAQLGRRAPRRVGTAAGTKAGRAVLPSGPALRLQRQSTRVTLGAVTRHSRADPVSDLAQPSV